MATLGVRPIAESEIETAGQIFAAAFHEDPLQVYAFPDPAERARRSPGQFTALTRDAFNFGAVYVADGLQGVAAWVAPHGTPPANAAAQSEMPKLAGIMGKDALMRFGGALDHVTKAHGPLAPPRHWYLMIVGVRPEFRGHGLGAALIAPILARADAEKIPVCLDTAQPKVKPFYTRLGFRPTQESVDPASGVRFWAYQRDPA